MIYIVAIRKKRKKLNALHVISFMLELGFHVNVGSSGLNGHILPKHFLSPVVSGREENLTTEQKWILE
jgi:hypothetical protein